MFSQHSIDNFEKNKSKIKENEIRKLKSKNFYNGANGVDDDSVDVDGVANKMCVIMCG